MRKINFKTSNFHLLMLIALIFVSFLACDTTKKVVTQETTETVTLSSTPTADASQPNFGIVDKDKNPLRVRYVRKNAHEDSINMQILAEALDTMRKMNCADPLSWYMQGAIHGAPSHKNIFCDTVSYLEATNEAWHNCTHDYGSLDLDWDEARLHFYSWHKVYLDHFEEAVRYLTKKPEFSLPYWEYDNPNYQTLPDLLVDTTSSLYEAYRNKNLNDGGKIETDKYNDNDYCIPDFTDPINAFESKSFELFTKHLENVPHNRIHVYVGTGIAPTEPDPIGGKKSGYMLQMYSPMDPVFWIHHANIDRLYEKWFIKKIDDKLSNGGRPTKHEFTNRVWKYKFFKPGETTLTHYDDNLENVFDMVYGVQDYAYDMFIDSGAYNKTYEDKVADAIRTKKWDTNQFYFDEDHIVATNNKDIKIGAAGSIFFTISPLYSLARNLQDEEIKRRVWLLDIDVKFKIAPTESFTVKIQDKKNYDDNVVCSRKVAGVMSFFGAGHTHSISEDAGVDHDHAGNIQETRFLFDLTDEIDFQSFSGDLEIEIIPDNIKDRITLDKVQLKERVTKVK